MEDLRLGRPLKQQSSGPKVKLVQEWLNLHDIGVEIDGDFGPATGDAVLEFQRRRRMKRTGIVDRGTFAALTLPMVRALRPLRARSTLGRTVVAYARQHLRQHPREVGGQNRGPWVRLYMDGQEGKSWPWCAGFACFVVKQACDTAGVALPFEPSYSSSQLKRNAARAGRFLTGADVKGPRELAAGALFLQRGGRTGWKHTGLVVRVMADRFLTVEGNTNDDGSAEGYEVCSRTRGFRKRGRVGYDFIAVQPRGNSA